METQISGTTRLLALLGHPVAHSMSPALHNEAFAHLGIDARYFALDVMEENLEAALDGVRALGILGGNITVPHKSTCLPFFDELTEGARLMGAVNTFVLRDGKLIGHNTDGTGFTHCMLELNQPVSGKHICVIDVGAEGSAIFTQSAIEGAQRLTILSTRGPLLDRAREQARNLASHYPTVIDTYALEDEQAWYDPVCDADIIVNASRIGAGDVTQTPLPDNVFTPNKTVVETIYDPRETRLLKEAAAKGCCCVDGLTMLLAQAACAERIWLDCTMPTDHIKECLFDN